MRELTLGTGIVLGLGTALLFAAMAGLSAERKAIIPTAGWALMSCNGFGLAMACASFI